jgi:hypothetical protein
LGAVSVSDFSSSRCVPLDIASSFSFTAYHEILRAMSALTSSAVILHLPANVGAGGLDIVY